MLTLIRGFFPPWTGLFLQWTDSVRRVFAVSQLLLPARVRGPIGSLLCQFQPELRHRGLGVFQQPPLLGPLSPSLPLSLSFPFTLSILVCSREPPIRNYVKTGSSPGAHLKAVLLTCSEILTAIIIAYKSLRKFNYTKISWWKCAS